MSTRHLNYRIASNEPQSLETTPVTINTELLNKLGDTDVYLFLKKKKKNGVSRSSSSIYPEAESVPKMHYV